jgi:acyl transferase domain-containing protein
MSVKSPNEPIAVIGMACRFPGGANPSDFWDFLVSGGDAVSEIPADRWNAADYYDPDPNAVGKMYTKYGAFLPNFDYFSPAFFGISPREAQFMDPQQRILLEVAWEALENAAVVPEHLSEQQVGIFVGIGTSDYGDLQIPSGPPGVDAYNGTGGSHAAAAGRLSYALGLRGPSLAVDTACSSSLVTVHLAIMSLRAGECDLALASGVNLNFAPDIFVSLCKARMLSPDGRCKAFDASANGYVRGEGCGVVVLKRLPDALADGDHIHALLRGSAVNHNGRSSGLTVPSGPAQQEVIRTALKNAGIQPSEVSYLEAHGTGTAVGDPIEAGAISAVFAKQSAPLLIGSVKTNCGHLEWAAGVCGLVKVILSMQHDRIPASLHFKEPNPLIKWDRVPFRVLTEPSAWPLARKIAGVSSFGFGGTNAHVIVEEAPGVRAVAPTGDRPTHVFTLSAKSEKALRDNAAQFAAEAERCPNEALANICFTANTGRTHFEHRLVAQVSACTDLVEGLRGFAEGQTNAGFRASLASEPAGALAMLFTGQGSQRPGMGRELYDSQPTFREAIDRCAEILRPHLNDPLLEVLYPKGVSPDDLSAPIHDTGRTQPALFAVEYALATLWRSWGIEPDVVLGHSVGEYVAACVAGVFDLEEGLRLIAARGRLMQALPRDGAMLAVHAAEDLVAPLLERQRGLASIAAINGPRDVVISGATDAMDAIAAELKSAGVTTRRLVVSHAFHSPLMEPMLEDYRRVAETVTFRPPVANLISNVTGVAAGEEVASADYWVRHVRDTVRFADGIRAALAEGCTRFLEAGPQPVLCAMGQATLSGESLTWLPSLQARRSDWSQMLDSLETLYLLGCKVDWKGFDRNYPRAKAPLPTYPFERQRFWFPPIGGVRSRPGATLSPLVDSIARSPLVKETILSVSLSVVSHRYLADHVVFGQAIVPGAAYLAILASGGETMGWPSCRLSNVFFLAPLLLPDGKGQQIQAVLTPDEGSGRFRFDIVAVDAQESEAPRLASGTIEPLAAPVPSQIDLEDLQRRCAKSLEPDQLFEAAEAAGVQLGSKFRWIVHAWTGDREALGQLRAPEEVGDLAGHVIHPVLLDSCFQIAGATLMGNGTAESLLPFSLESVTVHRAAKGTGWWCHAQRKGDAMWDIRLLDESGVVIATLDGFEMRKAASDRFFRPRMTDWLYRLAWQVQPLAQSSYAAISGAWLLLTSGGEVAGALSQRLAALGSHCVIACEGSGFDFSAIERDAAWIGRATIRGKEPDDIVRLLERRLSLGLPPIAGAIDLRGLDSASGPESIVERSQKLATGFLYVRRRLNRRRGCWP